MDDMKQLKKHINKIKTNLLEPGDPKDPDTSTVFQLWEAFATEPQAQQMRENFEQGIAWGEAKKELFELINGQIGEARERYYELMERPADIEEILQQGAVKARAVSAPFIEKLRQAVGLRSFA